jgi:translocation and assembly module TamB
MAEKTDFDDAKVTVKRRSKLRLFFVVFAVLLALIIALIYVNRIDLASDFTQDVLKDYGVKAKFDIKEIGLRTQRIENVVIGDPANPDLTLKWAEIDIGLNFSGATPRDVRASGVRIRGQYKDGKLSFGELDKFRDPTNKKPFEFPDIGLDFDDTRVRLETPWGVIGAGLDGSGLLRQEFNGNLAVRSSALANADCRADDVQFNGRYLIDFRQPNLIGPLSASAVQCKALGVAAEQPVLNADARLSQTFESWLGDIGFSAKKLTTADLAFSNPHGTLKFDGDAGRTNFESQLNGATFASTALNVRNLTAMAKGRLAFAGGHVDANANGDIKLQGSALNRSYLAAVNDMRISAAGTPLGPLFAQIAPALQNAADNFGAALHYDASMGADGNFEIRFNGGTVQSRTGLHLAQSGAAAITGKNKKLSFGAPMSLSMAGGGLPTAQMNLAQTSGGGWKGGLQMQSFKAANASLAVPNLTFAVSPSGTWQVDGRALVSGPVAGGFVSGLNVPIDARWNGARVSLFRQCQNLTIEKFRYSTLSLSSQSLRLCPEDGGGVLQSGQGGTRLRANMPNFNIAGTLDGERISAKGSNLHYDLNSSGLNSGGRASNVAFTYGASPIRVTAPIINFTMKGGFNSKAVKVEIGTGEDNTRFNIASINGRARGNGSAGGFAGRMEGAGGKIASVPLLMDEVAGDWTFISGNFALDGGLRVSDAEQVDRFKPLNAPDAMVTLEGGVISALADLYEPTTGIKIAGVDIRHVLKTGSGRALLAVDDLKFNDKLQPEMITPLTLGVIQNAKGSVYGDGKIVWDNSNNGIVSTGIFGTKGLDFAAAFGPVRGLQTEMSFTDLLGLETAPTQIAHIASINPGVAALDGLVRYHLLAGQKVQIEGGSFPFAGGELIIRPTIWDLGVAKPRELVLEVKDVEVAKFIEQFDFGNLAATGVFNGKLPMIFDADGGRIIGGELIAKSGGGNISYIGELSYKDLSPYANFAFDALRSIDYTGLRIGMNGNLGGEIITDISFEGVKQGKGAKQNFITRQLASIPIKFNIRIEASFFELFGSVRSFYDPQYLVRNNLLEIQRRQKEAAAKAAGGAKDDVKSK